MDSNHYSFISSAYWEVVTTWFYSTGCHEFALSKIILHVHIQNGWIWKPYIQCFAYVFNKPNYIQWFAQAFMTLTFNGPVKHVLILKTLCFHRVIRVYFYSVHASTFNEVIYFCVQKFPPAMQVSRLFMHLVVYYIWWQCLSDVCFPVISVSPKNGGQWYDGQ